MAMRERERRVALRFATTYGWTIKSVGDTFEGCDFCRRDIAFDSLRQLRKDFPKNDMLYLCKPCQRRGGLLW